MKEGKIIYPVGVIHWYVHSGKTEIFEITIENLLSQGFSCAFKPGSELALCIDRELCVRVVPDMSKGGTWISLPIIQTLAFASIKDPAVAEVMIAEFERHYLEGPDGQRGEVFLQRGFF